MEYRQSRDAGIEARTGDEDTGSLTRSKSVLKNEWDRFATEITKATEKFFHWL